MDGRTLRCSSRGIAGGRCKNRFSVSSSRHGPSATTRPSRSAKESTILGCTIEKLRLLEELGAERTAARGNDANDRAMLGGAALGICVLGLEGAAGETLRVVDMVVVDPNQAMDALLDGRLLRLTMRSRERAFASGEKG